MRRDDALRIIGAHADELRQQFDVRSLSLFGSVARDQARADSDVDVLVEFERTVSLFAFVRLRDRLSEILGQRVDLSETDALHRRLKDRILREAIRAA
jgi:predicted nucleotidyltransferase